MVLVLSTEKFDNEVSQETLRYAERNKPLFQPHEVKKVIYIYIYIYIYINN